LDLKEIKAIIDLMKKNDLAVFKLEREGFKLELEVNRPSPSAVALAYPQIAAQPVYPAAPGVACARPSASGQAAGQTTESYKEIVSPMVGTFYRGPSPDSAPFVEFGQEVTEDTVVCIIEAMKVMNEIKAEVSGSILEILVENGTPVQFGQSLFRVK
jgi:acetyl-CoA carboxylase biotin carboxyl carrier protein